MTFKVGDKVRRKAEWIDVDFWNWGNTVCTINMIDRAGDLHFDNGAGGFWFKDRFERVERVKPQRGIDWDIFDIGDGRLQVQRIDEVETMTELEAIAEAQRVGIACDDEGNLIEEDQPLTPKSGITAWSDAEIGPFAVSVNCKTDLSAVDTLNRLWFKDPVGQKLNRIALEHQESPDMTEDQLVTKILTELQSMDGVTTIIISWKHRTNGIAWERG